MKKKMVTVLLTAATVFSAILPTTCMAAEKKADIPEGTTISFWHAMGGEELDWFHPDYTRERYSPVLVSIFSLSPWLTNSGT